MALFARQAVMRAVTLALALVFASPAAGQSDATCIAYMEADEDYRRAKLAARTSPAYLAARQREQEADRKVEEASRRDAGAFASYLRSALNQAPAGQKDATELPQESSAYTTAVMAYWDAKAAADAILSEALDRAKRARAEAYTAAYRGPTSDYPRIMAKVIAADRARCGARGM